MTKLTAAALAAALALSASAAVSGQLVKQLTISPGKGISFFMGGQQGTAMFNQASGACGLTIFISPNAAADGMSGMSGNMIGTTGSSVFKVDVLPARPANFVTPDGQKLVFNCGPDGAQMFLEMPSEFKYSERNS
jgi:hypothetical protein